MCLALCFVLYILNVFLARIGLIKIVLNTKISSFFSLAYICLNCFLIPVFLFLHISVAVVVAFFLCWAPFHAQRLVAFYGNDQIIIYAITTYVSGILYYLSTCINPLLYNIMSNKFREAFKVCFTIVLYFLLIYRYVNMLTTQNHDRSSVRSINEYIIIYIACKM